MKVFSFLQSTAVLLFALVFSIQISAQDKNWRHVSAEELASKAPVVDADADAEATFWEVRIDDSSEDLSMKHYVRVKIFTERGREKYSKFDIPFVKGMKIKDLAARVIKADGTIVEVGKDEIFEREIIKTNGLKVKAKSFAVPNIEPGVIVEYRYKEVVDDGTAKGMRLQFQRDIPIQNLAYYYKPYNKADPSYQNYNFTDTKFVKDRDGYWLAARSKVPALKEEAQMPPEDMVRPWMLLTSAARLGVAAVSGFTITYTVKAPGVPELYWGAVTTENAGYTKFMNKGSGDIKKAAQEITAGAGTPDEKLRKLYEYCQTQIANTSFDTSITEEQRKKLPETRSINDVLKRKSASAPYIDMLFGALANALGFESRVGLISNRNEMFFEPKMTNENLLHLGVVGVKVGEKWKLFNPGMKFLPYGMLVWYEEDSYVLLVGEKDYFWIRTPMSPHDRSEHKRTGRFNLLEDGTLEGTVTMELSGQPAISYRAENYDEAATKREDGVKQDVLARMSTAEVSDIAIENIDDPAKPLVFRYKVRVPNYAQKTGKRMFVQPGFFEYGETAPFSSSSRKYDIFFRYPWSEKDAIEITFPKSYALDNADAPAPLADPLNITSLNTKISIDNGKNALLYDRKFYFGGGGHVLFPASSYPAVKSMFDAFSKADSHTITLKQK